MSADRGIMSSIPSASAHISYGILPQDDDVVHVSEQMLL